MGHNRLREATDRMLDRDRFAAYSAALRRMVGDGVSVLDCGAGVGELTAVARAAGATVTAYESDPVCRAAAAANVGSQRRVTLVDGDPAAHTEATDIVILDVSEPLLLSGDVRRVVNALYDNGVLGPAAYVLPAAASFFGEIVTYDFGLLGMYLPAMVQGGLGDTRRTHTLGSAVPCGQLRFNSPLPESHTASGRCRVARAGRLDALRLTTVLTVAEGVLLGGTFSSCPPVYVPVKSQLVNVGDYVNFSIGYTLGGGPGGLHVDVAIGGRK